MIGINPARWSRSQVICALLILFLLPRIPFLTALPFMKDEGLYSVMIEEADIQPTMPLTFLGQPIIWKPPLMFWTYGIFVQALRGLPIPIELVYRLPFIRHGVLHGYIVSVTAKRKPSTAVNGLCAHFFFLFHHEFMPLIENRFILAFQRSKLLCSSVFQL